MQRSKMRLEIIATNGATMVRSAWCEVVKGQRICGSIYNPRAKMHFSYHLDGTVHTKLENPALRHLILGGGWNEKGYAPSGPKGPPLSEFKGARSFIAGGVTLDDKYFSEAEPYAMKRADRVILVDSRSVTGMQKMVGYYFDLVEKSNYMLLCKRIQNMEEFISADGQSICEHHCFLAQDPWLLVHVAYCSNPTLLEPSLS